MKHIRPNSDCTNTIISLELDDNGNKIIHFMGYGYYIGTPLSHPYRFLEYTFFGVLLEEGLRVGLQNYEDKNSEDVKQYIQDCTEEEFNNIFEHYDNGKAPIRIKEADLVTAKPGIYEII